MRGYDTIEDELLEDEEFAKMMKNMKDNGKMPKIKKSDCGACTLRGGTCLD